MEKKRIEYIDLMKGICITMVVLLHCHYFEGEKAIIDTYLRPLRMPLYFFLAGLFFKTYSSFKCLLIKKINNLVIPYLFFSILAFVPHMMANFDRWDIFSFEYYVVGTKTI